MSVGKVFLCEETGRRMTEDLVCPVHGGDNCLAMYVHHAHALQDQLGPQTLEEALGGFVEADEDVAKATAKVFRDQLQPPEEVTRLRRERDQLREALERLVWFRDIGPSDWAWNKAREILDDTTPTDEPGDPGRSDEASTANRQKARDDTAPGGDAERDQRQRTPGQSYLLRWLRERIYPGGWQELGEPYPADEGGITASHCRELVEAISAVLDATTPEEEG